MLAAHPAEASAVDKHLVSAKACPAHASAQPRPLPYLPRRTVDLVHLLCDYGVKFRFLTTTIGVNPDYKNEAFYRSTLDADALRVKDLFERAAASGIEIERRSLSDGELCDLTRPPHDSLVMALVDRRYLESPYCRSTGQGVALLQDRQVGIVDPVRLHQLSPRRATRPRHYSM